MTAIQTEYRGPSTRKGARMVAFSSVDPSQVRVELNYSWEISDYMNHCNVAASLIAKYSWGKIEDWRSADLKRGLVWVRANY